MKEGIALAQKKQFRDAILRYQQAIILYLEKQEQQSLLSQPLTQDDALRNVYFRLYKAQLEFRFFEGAQHSLEAAAEHNLAIVTAGGKSFAPLTNVADLKNDIIARMEKHAGHAEEKSPVSAASVEDPRAHPHSAVSLSHGFLRGAHARDAGAGKMQHTLR